MMLRALVSRMLRPYRMGVAALALAAVAACTGSGVGLNANGQPVDSSGNSSGALTANFQSIQENVFTPICTRCHSGASAPEGLQLDVAHSYGLLVGVPSNEVPTLLRVKPADPNDSYLILKLQGSARIVGAQMPYGGPYLPQSTIDVIRQWITDGAAGPAQSADASAFTVTATTPMAGSAVSAPVTRLFVVFNHELNPSLLSDATVFLDQIGDSSTASATTDMAVLLERPVGNPSTLMITPTVPLQSGAYRLTLNGTGGAALADMDAQALTSDYSLSFTVDSVK